MVINWYVVGTSDPTEILPAPASDLEALRESRRINELASQTVPEPSPSVAQNTFTPSAFDKTKHRPVVVAEHAIGVHEQNGRARGRGQACWRGWR